MKFFWKLIILVFIAGILSGCKEKGPFTVMFTGDVRGRIVPAG